MLLVNTTPATKVAWQRTGTEVPAAQPACTTPPRDFSRRSLPCGFSRRSNTTMSSLIPEEDARE
jgi:hypothetical protein